jgi:hypothetical protein
VFVVVVVGLWVLLNHEYPKNHLIIVELRRE